MDGADYTTFRSNIVSEQLSTNSVNKLIDIMKQSSFEHFYTVNQKKVAAHLWS